MHLVTCSTPQEPLEAAPRTALVADMADGERWDGFWSSDAYYIRRTARDGEVAWYQFEDDEAPRGGATDARVLPLRPRSRVAVVVARSPGGRRMLVGSARRPSR
jgi:hypothetical protein